MAVTSSGYYVKHTASGDKSSGRITITNVIWSGFTDGAHTLQIKDGAGTVVLPAIACGAAASVLGPIIIPLNITINGVETDVLDSGVVVYQTI